MKEKDVPMAIPVSYLSEKLRAVAKGLTKDQENAAIRCRANQQKVLDLIVYKPSIAGEIMSGFESGQIKAPEDVAASPAGQSPAGKDVEVWDPKTVTQIRYVPQAFKAKFIQHNSEERITQEMGQDMALKDDKVFAKYFEVFLQVKETDAVAPHLRKPDVFWDFCLDRLKDTGISIKAWFDKCVAEDGTVNTRRALPYVITWTCAGVADTVEHISGKTKQLPDDGDGMNRKWVMADPWDAFLAKMAFSNRCVSLADYFKNESNAPTLLDIHSNRKDKNGLWNVLVAKYKTLEDDKVKEAEEAREKASATTLMAKADEKKKADNQLKARALAKRRPMAYKRRRLAQQVSNPEDELDQALAGDEGGEGAVRD